MTNVRSVSRRTVTQGAAWSVPVVASAVAAPALAASPALNALTVQWLQSSWRPGPTTGSSSASYWSFQLQLTNTSTSSLTIFAMALHSTFGAPATNAGKDLVVQGPDSIGIPIAARASTLLTTSYVPTSREGTPPRDATGTVLLPSYYNHDSDHQVPDDTIPCLTTPTKAGGAAYPDACRRLTADHTYWVLSYRMNLAGAPVGTTIATMNGTVGCTVMGANCTP